MTDMRAILGELLDTKVSGMRPLSGGDVADSYEVELATGERVFAKTKRGAPPEFFITEAAGLAWLREAAAVPLPEVLAVSDDPAALVLEWIEPGARHHSTEADFGRSLAALHGTAGSCFGREDRRSTGSRGLPNEPAGSWAEFYAENRLRPLARLASDAHALPGGAIRHLEAIADDIAGLVGPIEAPARLHGDLWGGNRLIGSGGVSWLIDPAAIGGHREFDLAMMRLFGGFGEDCYTAYAEVAPLAADWESRISLHQLAPLVVHSIKFGGSYVPATERALDLVR